MALPFSLSYVIAGQCAHWRGNLLTNFHQSVENILQGATLAVALNPTGQMRSDQPQHPKVCHPERNVMESRDLRIWTKISGKISAQILRLAFARSG